MAARKKIYGPTSGIYVPGGGSASARLMIIAEAPGAQEEDAAKNHARICTLVGPTGMMCKEMTEKAGYSWGDTYRTNIVKFRPPDNKLKRLHEIGHTIEEGLPQLWDEINTIKPNCILTLGETALKYITGRSKISHWRGSILETSKGLPKVVPTYHPAALFKGGDGGMRWQAKAYIELDIQRAVEESKTTNKDLPKRTHEIAKSSLDVYRFFNEYWHKQGLRRVSVDIEAFKCIPICIGFAFNAFHGLCIPILDLPEWQHQGWKPISAPERAEMWRMCAEILEHPDIQIIGQNYKFDQQKLLSPLGIVSRDPYIDNMLLAHTLYPEFPKSQAFLTSVWTREPYYKDEYKDFDFKKDKIEQVFFYNGKDVTVAYEVSEAMLPELNETNTSAFFRNFQMAMHPLFMDIERVGFGVDRIVRDRLISKYKTQYLASREKLNSLVGREINIRSNPQLRKLFYEELKLPERDSCNEDTIYGLLGNNVKNPLQQLVLENVLEQRRSRKAWDLVSTPLDYDGRMRTNERMEGTETGRRSDKNLKPPIRPWWADYDEDRRKLRADGKYELRPIGMPFKTITKHGEIGADAREMFIADDGMVFGEADSSQAEARVVSVLADDFETLELYDKLDFHRLTAAWFFFRDEKVLTKEAIPDSERFVGKTGRHMGHLGAGKNRFMTEINSGSRKYNIKDKQGNFITISEAKAGEILDIFHARTPKIRTIFHAGVTTYANSNHRTLIAPSGRRRQFFGRPGPELEREYWSFLPQAIVGDNTILAMFEVKKKYPNLQIILESHDAFLWQCLLRDFDEIASFVQQAMQRKTDFKKCSIYRDFELSIPCEVKYGFNYKEMTKWSKGCQIVDPRIKVA